MTAGTEPLSIRQLEVFVALVDQGSFTKAARYLGLSQSTVSGHVADLERRLGARVVERGRRKVTPTAAGQALLAPARATLEAERTTRMAVEELTGLLRGRLVVGGSTIPAAYLLPHWLAEFHARHAEIALRLVMGDSREMLHAVRAADVELGVVGARPARPGLVALPVATDRLVLVAPPGHPLAGRGPVGVAELRTHAFVMREEGSGTRAATLRALEAAGADAQALRISCEVGSTEATKGAVVAGLGLAFVSDLAVREERASGSLQVVPVQGFNLERTFFLVHREGAYLGPAARAFVEAALVRAAGTGRAAS
jgi:DNA-binding transcriptional LysR family regulator